MGYADPVAKRALDVMITLLALPIAAPVTLVAAAVLAMELRGNPIFLQERIGRRGRPFTMVKLRTMHHAAPGEEDAWPVEDWETFVFAPPGERNPRLTRFGELARRTSIDEIPNLINVLRGEMSIVGPRPELPEIVAQYPHAYHRRHAVPPGITGLAQVAGRSDLTYSETVSYDLEYVDRHSVLVDLHILWRTLLVVLAGSGAR